MGIAKKHVDGLVNIVTIHLRSDPARQMLCEFGRSSFATHNRVFKEMMDLMVIELDARRKAAEPPPPKPDTDSIRAAMTPDVVIVSADSKTDTPARATERGAEPVIIYVRDDGWSLGAPMRFREEARQLYAGRWAEAWIKLPSGAWQRQWPIGG